MNRIKELRNEKGITQADLAKILKISDRAVGYYENGDREPDYTTLLKIAEYFDVSIDYLLGRVDVRKEAASASEDADFMNFYHGYKDLDDEDKDVLKATLEAFVRAKKKGDK
jgi:transcriptional regulator with XRE-family HTH domain